MKFVNDRRVDLTENSDFQRPRQSNTSFMGFRLWEVRSDSELWHGFDKGRKRRPSLYPTGSAAEITNCAKYAELLSGSLCDRCGVQLMPWEHCLCRKCGAELAVDCHGRIPWQTHKGKSERIPNIMKAKQVPTPRFILQAMTMRIPDSHLDF